MGEFYSEKEIVINMKDAGCDDREIQDFINLMASGNERRAVRVLEKHRAKLLVTLHTTQDSISCLDYLIYRMENQNMRR